jgi:hypothetical protein
VQFHPPVVPRVSRAAIIVCRTPGIVEVDIPSTRVRDERVYDHNGKVLARQLALEGGQVAGIRHCENRAGLRSLNESKKPPGLFRLSAGCHTK